MSSGICRLMSNDAVDLKIRVLVIGGAVGLKVVGLVITAEAAAAAGSMSNAVSVNVIAGHFLDILVFRGVLSCSVAFRYRNGVFFSGVWLGLLLAGDLRLVKRRDFEV